MRLQLYTEDDELGWETDCCCVVSGIQALADKLSENDPALDVTKLRACRSLIAAQKWCRDQLDGGILKAVQL